MKDLLNGIGGRGGSEDSAEEDSGDIELSLGLSLGGCFGVDPRRKGGLVRSSSIASMLQVGEREGEREREKLVRTCSLPVEADEEHKRKFMQTMRRMEAKKRRMEKRGGKCEVEGKVGNWASGGFTWRGGAAEEERTSGALSQRSVGSQGSCSAGEAGSLDGGRMRGLRCAVNVGSKPLMATSGNDALKNVDDGGRGQGGSERTMMEQMPCVSTKGEGPNGRVIEGFLYKYNKGEEVKIVCVCHGRFLTPAEFVRHAGGGDVAYPLRHIVVKTPSFAFL